MRKLRRKRKKKFSKTLFWLIRNFGLITVRLLGRSWRYMRINEPPRQKVIFAFWHRNILPLLYLHQKEKLVVLISNSEDGDLIAEACQKLGYLTVRGSSNRGGILAAREMIKYSRTNTLGITPDGPLGPSKKIKEGLVFVAKATGLPVVMADVDVRTEITFNSWDKFRLPLPFSVINVIYDEPYYVDRKADTSQVISQLESRMHVLEQQLVKYGNNERKPVPKT